MAVCNFCHLEMSTRQTRSCLTAPVAFADGVQMPQVRYEPGRAHLRCSDCGISPGGVHHPGCGVERCPRCGGQLIACGCNVTEGDDGEEAEEADDEE